MLNMESLKHLFKNTTFRQTMIIEKRYTDGLYTTEKRYTDGLYTTETSLYY